MHPGKHLFILATLAISFQLKAQVAPTDTVALARDLAGQKRFSEANQLLVAYNQNNHVKDALWFEAQLAYWRKDIAHSKKLYADLVTEFPEDRTLALDYGRFLFETGHNRDAKKVLLGLLQQDPQEPAANKMLASLEYWQGNSLRAVSLSDRILQLDSTNSEVRELRQNARIYGAPRAWSDIAYTSDDQELQSWSIQGGAAIARSRFFAPEFAFQMASFSSGTETSLSASTGHFELLNNMRFGYGKTQVKLRAGAYIHPNQQFFTGHISLRQQLTKHFHFEGQWGQQPYQYTLASIRTPFTYKNGSLAIGFEKDYKWMGQVAYFNQSFRDGNHIDVLSAWLIAPVLTRGKWSLQAGYAFSYSNAAENRFRAKDSLATIVDRQSLYDPVVGVFDPYFTPANQYVNYLLAIIKGPVVPKLSLQAKFNYGIYAQAENPYLMLDRKENQFFVGKGYSVLKYVPMEADVRMNYELSGQTSLSATYIFNKLFFYTRHQVQLGIKHRFGR